MEDNEIVKLQYFDDLLEAEIARGLLHAHKIQCYIYKHSSGRNPNSGYGYLMVLKSDVTRATDLLKAEVVKEK